MKAKQIFSTLFLASAGAFIGVSAYTYWIAPKTNNIISSSAQQQALYRTVANAPASTVPDFTVPAEISVNAVVHIKTKATVQNNLNDPFYNFFFGTAPTRPQIQMGTGSGVIISNDGYITTNNHVVAGAQEVEVVLNNNKSFNAKVIGTDPSTDLALLKIDETNLPYLVYGNSDDVKVGEWVLAVGNPLNLTSTVTAGIVSAKARNINIIGEGDPGKNVFPIESFIQTDAAVNPGNSGGALVNTRGELVGINTAIASTTGAYAGYSFAVPVNIVKKVMNDLLEFGMVQRAFIGVNIRDITGELAQEKNLPDLKGVYIAGLTEGGAAEEAGIKEGDVIKKIGSVEVNSTTQLQEQIGKYRPNDKIAVTINREGKEKLITLLLKNKNGSTSILKKSKEETFEALGASFEEVSNEEKRELRINYGLRVVNLGAGKLRSAGVKEGFIITSIDKKPIKSLDDLSAAMKDKKGGILVEGVYPNGLRAYYGFGL
ncbi:MAG: trypsin-like peptidase domain-containing protein [Bacteroidia bacterium]|nr:trypsin-like peptidase domain-containing protein [Bacteroidia bacterium]